MTGLYHGPHSASSQGSLSPGSAVQMEREQCPHPTQTVRATFAPAPAPLRILNQVKLLLSNFSSFRVLSFPAQALGSNQTTSFLLLWFLLPKFFNPFHHPIC